MQWLSNLTGKVSAAIKRHPGNIFTSLKNKWSTDYQLTHQPLLNNEDLITIHASATSAVQPLTSTREVATMLVGERGSSYAGSGYEFAENQLYAAGDDSRFINWRMLAKTGKMYRKKFIEERRPELWVVVDKGASMRFGTRTRLKVSHAAIQAIYHLYQGQQQQLACGGVILDEGIRWYKPVQENHSLQPLIKHIITAAPPLYEDKDIQANGDSLNFTLRQLISRATAGSIIILLSDFHHLSAEVPGSLYELTKKHNVVAKHILDPIELELPATGKFQVMGLQNRLPHLLDCDDAGFRKQYHANCLGWQRDIEKQLTSSGASYQLCMEDDNSLVEINK